VNFFARHSSAGWNPVLFLIYEDDIKNWIPAFAMMTIKIKMDPRFREDDDQDQNGSPIPRR